MKPDAGSQEPRLVAAALPDPVEAVAKLRRLLLRAEAQLPPAEVPAATPPRGPRRLTIGMATYDDYDGVYFTIQSLRFHHPDVQDHLELLVVDNHPEGPAGAALKRLERWVKNYRYIPFRAFRGTAVRDVIFRESAADYVMCVDAHVLIAPGALERLLDYLAAHDGTGDLMQGPLLLDDLTSISTHFEPVWRQGMYGIWATDPRGVEADQEPFEIPMQGLGLFVARRDAWLGFNPRFRGFGGEEGYIHEKYRQAGRRTVCLPFLRWVHRFERPGGVPYPNAWAERIRNYLIGWRELGLDPAPVVEHFNSLLGEGPAGRLISEVQAEIDNPFSYFDGIYAITRADQPERWQRLEHQLERLGAGRLIRRFEAVVTPENHHIGVALSHRGVLAEARRLGLGHVLVLEDDVVFHRDALDILRGALHELRERPWDLFYLGGYRWSQAFATPPGCRYLERPQRMTCTHALCYHHAVIDRLLEELPETGSDMTAWIGRHCAIDQYLAQRQDGMRCFITRPSVATQRELIPGEPVEEQAKFLA